MTLTAAPAAAARSNVVGIGLNLSRAGAASRAVVAPRVHAPPQRVDDADIGQPERVADQPVLTGTAAGTHCGEPGDGGGGKADLQRATAQARHDRRVGGVRVQQLGAQAVDEQHARPAHVVR